MTATRTVTRRTTGTRHQLHHVNDDGTVVLDGDDRPLPGHPFIFPVDMQPRSNGPALPDWAVAR